ncbi:MAG: type II secretion system minor pseudopilin GspJ [Candidatus Accumulibacter sp.]|jgi:general secretion pathway protein J|nr:type II secretion system minor pseudopilin GspJ [Accumulibacter sp.]
MSRVSRTETARSEGGFTLLEILVALAIFALASVIAYGGLDSVASTKSALDREIRFWRELGLVFDRMEADFLQSVPHPLRDGPERLSPPLRGGNAGPSGESRGFFVELIRQDGSRAQVRVRYLCEQGRLTLRASALNPFGMTDFGAADGGNGMPGVIDTPLLQAVERCEAAFLGAGNAWLGEWPGDQALARPQAIRVRLTLTGQGAFERVFHLP